MTQPDTIEDILSGVPMLEITDAAMLVGIVEDIAQDIYPKEVIATRYGFRDVAELRQYLVKHPELVRRIQRHRALHQSDANAQERVRLQSCAGLSEEMHSIVAVISDKNVPITQRIDAFKAMVDLSGAKASGVQAAKADTRAAAGTRFNITINLPGQTQRITTVVDGALEEPPEVADEDEPPALSGPV